MYTLFEHVGKPKPLWLKAIQSYNQKGITKKKKRKRQILNRTQLDSTARLSGVPLYFQGGNLA